MALDYSDITTIYGSLITTPYPGDKRKISMKYDRKSFYPSLFFDIDGFPTNQEVGESYHTGRYVKVVYFSVKAVRKEKRNGIFFNEQTQFVIEEEIAMFSDELKIFKEEFFIWSMRVIRVERLKLYRPSEGFRISIKTLLTRKEKLRGKPGMEEEYATAKKKLNENIGFLASIPNGNLDRLSLAYLQHKARMEMYDVLDKHRGSVVRVFVDEVSLSEDISELHDSKVWRN